MDAVDLTLEAPHGASLSLGMLRSSIPETLLKRQHLYDLAFRNVTRLFASLVLALLVGIMVSLLIGSWPAIKAFGPGFLVSAEWNPVTEKFGALVPIFGTVVTSFRSEERRVGKECRSRWSPYHYK